MVWFLALLLLLPLSSWAGTVVYHPGQGNRVVGYYPGEIPAHVPAGHATLTVTDPVVWPAPPAGTGYTTCATGRQEWTRVQDGALAFNPTINVFRCRQAYSRREVLQAIGQELQESGDLVEQTMFALQVQRRRNCPPADVTPTCVQTRALLDKLLDNTTVDAIEGQARAFLQDKGL